MAVDLANNLFDPLLVRRDITIDPVTYKHISLAGCAISGLQKIPSGTDIRIAGLVSYINKSVVFFDGNKKPLLDEDGHIIGADLLAELETISIPGNCEYIEFILKNQHESLYFANIYLGVTETIRFDDISDNSAGNFDPSNVINHLNQTASGKILDARQGKVLNDLITTLTLTVAGKETTGVANTLINALKDGSTETIASLKTSIDTITNLVTSETPDGIANTLQEIIAVFASYPEGLDLITAFNTKVNLTDVANQLTQTESGKVLDARQGKVLNDIIVALKAGSSETIASLKTSINTLATTLLEKLDETAYNQNRLTDQTSLTSHTTDTSNPHTVTKGQIGLANVPNVDATSRANHTGTQLSTTISDFNVAVQTLIDQATGLGSGGTSEVTLNGIQTLTNKTLTSPVINTPTGLTKADVGLENVTNLLDADRPISTAQATAIGLKLDTTTYSTNRTTDTTVVANHVNNVSNPHLVTKGQIGLSNVDNTSDVNKPVSTAQASAIATASETAETNAVATLRDGVSTAGNTLAKLYTLIENINTIVGGTTPDGDSLVDTVAEILTVFAAYPEGVTLINALADKLDVALYESNRVIDQTSLSTHTTDTSNPHSVTKSQVGLSNVDNTSDINKPVSTAQSTALGLKLDSSTYNTNRTTDTGIVSTHIIDVNNPHAVTKAQIGLSNVDNTSDLSKPVSTAQATAIGLKLDTTTYNTNRTTDTTVTSNHIGDTENPHNVTKTQIGLSNVDNTADINKPVSTAQATAISAAQTTAISTLRDSVVTEGNTLAKLYSLIQGINSIIGGSNADGDSLVDTVAELLTVFATYPEGVTLVNALADKLDTAIYESNRTIDQASLSTHISNTSNPHSVTKTQIGLSNVDNTSDANKPVSTAQATALGLKLDASTYNTNRTTDTSVVSTHIADISNPHAVTKTQVGLGNVDNTSDVNKPVSTAQTSAIALKLDVSTYNTNRTTDQASLTTHTTDTSNPHAVTKSQVGLGNVDNTADSAKPVSTAQATALGLKLDSSTYNTNRTTDQESLTEHINDVENPHVVTKDQVGLSNVDNTSDASKPVSTATQTALNAKQPTLVSGTNIKTINGTSLLGSGDIVISGGEGGGTGDVTLNGTQTLTNKTLTSPVINTPTGIVKADVGLSNVDNTSDASKPVSTAQATAIGLKLDTSTYNTNRTTDTDIVSDHLADTLNPHEVTKSQVGLANVDNTSDINKPVSTAQATALDLKLNTTTYNTNRTTDTDIVSTHIADTENPHSVTKGQVGLANVDNTSDASKPVSSAQATAIGLKADTTVVSSHLADTSNPHAVTKTQVGLANVDNTSDVNKPVSTAQATAIGLKLDTSTYNTNRTTDTGVVTTHIADTANPHSVTKTQVGLSNVDNTSDANKPISTATQTALNGKEPSITAGTTLQIFRGDKTFVTLNQDIVPDGTTNKAFTATEKTKLAGIASGATANDTDANLKARANHTGTQAASTITGLATVATSGLKADVGLGNVDNTSDANKPISTATQTALNAKEPSITSGTTLQVWRGDKSFVTLNQDIVPDGTTNKAFTATNQTKLNGIATGATANDTDANLKSRANHTGTQAASTITGLATVATSGLKADVGLGNVDNTSDANKPISTATQTALNGKEATITAGTTAQVWRGDKTFVTLNQDIVPDGTTNKAFTATNQTKLAGIATGATANSTDAVLLARGNHTGTQSADTLTDGTTNKAFLATERTKLTGIATSATANDTDANLKARANHTGTQSADTLTDGTTNKAFLATERTKLTGIATGATANSSDAVLLARANHTGTQAATTITEDSTHRFATDAEKTTWNAKEAGLGNPATDGYVLSSTIAGVRSWIAAGSGGGVSLSDENTWTAKQSFGGTLTGTSGTVVAHQFNPTINQSSTAGYTALLVNSTHSAIGSGTKRLLDLQVGGSSMFWVDHNGNVNLNDRLYLAGGDALLNSGGNLYHYSSSGHYFNVAGSNVGNWRSGGLWVGEAGAGATHASAQMEIVSTTKGILIPKLTTTQRDLISSPATGLLIYNISTVGFEFWNGTIWTSVSTGVAGANGTNAYTTTSASFTQPAINATVSVSVDATAWMGVGQNIFITTGGYYSVSSITNSTTVVLTNLGYTGNTSPTTSITSGKKVSPGGIAFNPTNLVVQPSDQPTTSTTIGDIPGLNFAVVSGKSYKFTINIIYNSAAAATGGRFSINGPTTSYLVYRVITPLSSSAATRYEALTTYDLPSSAVATTTNLIGNNAVIEGVLTASANGTVSARFATENAGTAITSKGGLSNIEWRELI